MLKVILFLGCVSEDFGRIILLNYVCLFVRRIVCVGILIKFRNFAFNFGIYVCVVLFNMMIILLFGMFGLILLINKFLDLFVLGFFL